ncbi:MAG: tetratricopeptide repeat protein [Roseburia sp.]|nr:tetratricopeptide repeat protein [Roseburia sp.]
MNIGKQIRMYRLQKKVKQEEMAAYLGVSTQAVSKWETESSVPDIALLPGIATYFGVSIDDLFQISHKEQFERIENMLWNESRIRRENFDQASAFLEGVIREEPSNATAYEYLADLYNHRAKSDHEKASEYAKKVLELNPESKGGWVAFLEANNGVCGDEWYDNHFEVIEFFANFLKKNPKNYLGLYAIIENLLADGRYEDAVPYIKDLQSIKDDHQAYTYMGDVAFGRGDHTEALRQWNLAVEKSPNAWQAYCSRADRYKKIGLAQEAIADYEKCYEIQTPPRLTDGLYSLAQMYEEAKEYEKAIDAYERILKCLREEHGQVFGTAEESCRKEIARLQMLAEQSK